MTFLAPTRADVSIQHRPPRVTRGIRAVCLDVDDTIVDYTGSAQAALAMLLAGAGCTVESVWPIWQQVTDRHAAAVVTGALRYATMHVTRTQAFFAAIGEPLDRAEAERRERLRAAEMRRRWQLFPDAADCLDWLRAVGLKVAAVTNASGAHQRVKLADLGLADMFDAVVIAGEVGAAKPDPVIFRTACAQLGCATDEVVHVGDRLNTDAMGASRAGLHGVWLVRHGRTDLAAPDGVTVIDSLAELPELLVSELAMGSVRA